ncbi:cold shock CspA family protein [Streptomyces griseochromogenes]|uniref:Cold shock CspA family protein n=1 Tax=Streptomyces griseochromogenes TaxID=68214 RepID=A0A1B1ATM8_9ACTN|nr:cold shock domain-containing protein [Streptomyces griseochromogenes]ANP49905.1 DNA-binding protein [Streptomyces griseochromogenes]MBP2055465.1 cold shock CspA family protein [Streptomyces griseochromogenes]
MAVGRVIRFDGMRGYGFIAPEQGGEDVFLHVNDLLIPEATVRSGLTVEFEVEDGDRGLKASSVRLAETQSPSVQAVVPGLRTPAPSVGTAGESSSAEGQETMCDVLGSAEYTREVTELLLTSVPELTGQQILAMRKHLVLFGKRHGWVED